MPKISEKRLQSSGKRHKNHEFMAILSQPRSRSSFMLGAVGRTLFAVISVAGTASLTAQAVKITANDSYTQDFNSTDTNMPATGLPNWVDSNTVPAGTPTVANWYAQWTGSTYSGNIQATDGTNTNKRFSSFGSSATFGSSVTSDRALGAIPGTGGAAALGDVAWGVVFQNTSGQNAALGRVSYTGEQWRVGGTTAGVIKVFYKLSSNISDASTLNPGTVDTGWTEITGLRFTGPQTGSTASALDGNLAANRATISADLSAVLIPNGMFFTLRFSDTNASANGQALAIDDFSASYSLLPAAASPTFTPGTGTYSSPQSVSLSTASTGATIRYTTDGSMPTDTTGTLYTGTPITVSTPDTIYAIAYGAAYSDSVLSSAAYSFPAAAPTFSLSAGTYTTPQTLSMSTTTPGVSIHYKTGINMTAPTEANTLYFRPITIYSSNTYKAVASNLAGGYAYSPVTRMAYTINLPTASAPVFSPAPGSYTSPQVVTISSSPGTTIRYTTDPSFVLTPTAGLIYSGPITVGASETIYALAYGDNYASYAKCPATPCSSGAFTITNTAGVSFSPAGGTYLDSSKAVTISGTPVGATVRYTTDGSTPSATNGSVYTGPITVSTLTTIKAYASASGYSDSAVGTSSYSFLNANNYGIWAQVQVTAGTNPAFPANALTGSPSNTAPYQYKGVYADFNWSAIEPTDNDPANPTFDWSVLDADLQAAATGTPATVGGHTQNYSGPPVKFALAVFVFDPWYPNGALPTWLSDGLEPGHDVHMIDTSADGSPTSCNASTGVGTSMGPYPDYQNPHYQMYYQRMVNALGDHLRNSPYASNIVFVGVATGSTQDEVPYKGIPTDPRYPLLSANDATSDFSQNSPWSKIRIQEFGYYKTALQDPIASGKPGIPLLFDGLLPGSDGATNSSDTDALNWVRNNLAGVWGHREQVGYIYQLDGENAFDSIYVPHLVASAQSALTNTGTNYYQIFTRDEEDSTWDGYHHKSYNCTDPTNTSLLQATSNPNFLFQPNIPMSFYWQAISAVDHGLSIWHPTQSSLDWSGGAVSPNFGGTTMLNPPIYATPPTATTPYLDWVAFFNKYGPQVNAATATNAFIALHDGLDSNMKDHNGNYRFDTSYNGSGFSGSPAQQDQQRYVNICSDMRYAQNGAHMDTPGAVVQGQIAQRKSQNGLNDCGWDITQNYGRFMTQTAPAGKDLWDVSVGWWRIGATSFAPPVPPFPPVPFVTGGGDVTGLPVYARFGRGFDTAGRNEMDFQIDGNFFAGQTPGALNEDLTVNVTYYDKGYGTWALTYDGNTQSAIYQSSTTLSGSPVTVSVSGNMITNTNTGSWVKATFKVPRTANLNGYSTGLADLALVYKVYDVSTPKTLNPIFHMIELTK